MQCDRTVEHIVTSRCCAESGTSQGTAAEKQACGCVPQTGANAQQLGRVRVCQHNCSRDLQVSAACASLASQGWSSQHVRVRLRTPMHAVVDLCMHLLACRLEKRRSRLQAQVQAMQAVQQRERQTMREFGALAEEHLGAAAAPLRDAQQALAQVYVLLSSLHGCRKRLQWSGGRLHMVSAEIAATAQGACTCTMKHLPNAKVVCGHLLAVHLLHMHRRRHTGGCRKASNLRRRNLPCKQNSRSWMQLLRSLSHKSSGQLEQTLEESAGCTCMLSTLHMPMPAVQAAVIQSCTMTRRFSFLLLYDLGREQGAADDD